jgi:hypothetical protein
MSDFQKGKSAPTVEDFYQRLDEMPMNAEQQAAFNAERAESLAQRPQKVKGEKCYPPLKFEVKREKNADKWAHYTTTETGDGKEITVYDAESVWVANPLALPLVVCLAGVTLFNWIFGGKIGESQTQPTYEQPTNWQKSPKCLPPSTGLTVTRSDGRIVGNCQPTEWGVRRVG